ncbi:hypothetical protein ND16A_2974 [Thalassotalea sp. ND16A]|nr:hypothetical protein ND16A_2974 [Thalassotalea sp. ND16A]
MSQILTVAATIISLFLGLFVFIKLIMQIKKGKIQLASNYTAVYWANSKISFIRLIIVNFTITLFYFGMYTFCLMQLGFVQSVV